MDTYHFRTERPLRDLFEELVERARERPIEADEGAESITLVRFVPGSPEGAADS
jgi:hypothetical protein